MAEGLNRVWAQPTNLFEKRLDQKLFILENLKFFILG